MPRWKLNLGGNTEPVLQQPTLLSQLLLYAQTPQVQLIHSVMAAIGIPLTPKCAEVSTAQMKLEVSSHLALAALVAKQASNLAHLTLTPLTLSVITVRGMQPSVTLVGFSIMNPSLQQPIAVNAVTLQQLILLTLESSQRFPLSLLLKNQSL